MKNSRVLLGLAIALVAGGTYIIARHYRMVHLRDVAMSPLTNTVAADDAIRKLNGYSGSGATNLLYEIAVSRREFIDDRQVVAIELIADSHDLGVVADLTGLLQPHKDLDRREAVAAALSKNMCNVECARNVLHYEERLWCEREAQEESTLGASDELVIAALMARHNHLIGTLDKVLVRDAKPTLQVLRDIYGLGSPVPSPFALHVVDSLELRTACPGLASSQSQLTDMRQKTDLERLLKKLSCPQDKVRQ